MRTIVLAATKNECLAHLTYFKASNPTARLQEWQRWGVTKFENDCQAFGEVTIRLAGAVISL